MRLSLYSFSFSDHSTVDTAISEDEAERCNLTTMVQTHGLGEFEKDGDRCSTMVEMGTERWDYERCW
jgi:hypothetical protein